MTAGSWVPKPGRGLPAPGGELTAPAQAWVIAALPEGSARGTCELTCLPAELPCSGSRSALWCNLRASLGLHQTQDRSKSKTNLQTHLSMINVPRVRGHTSPRCLDSQT